MTTTERDVLITSNMNLARRMACAQKRRLGPGIELDDLIQAAYAGLVDAANRYCEGEVPFVGYATIRIFGEIKDFLRGQGVGKKSSNKRGIHHFVQFELDDEGRSMETRLEARSGEQFQEITESLPQQGQDILRMYFLDGMKLRQIGERLGVGEARVSQLLTKYREQLRREAA